MGEPHFDALNPQRLNPEQIIRCDRDLATINSIQSFTLTIPGAIPIVTAGYSVEAHCGGLITRPHEDIDIHVASLPVTGRPDFTRRLEELLRIENDHTKWTLYQINDFGWAQAVEFRENAPKRAWADRRRIELKLKTYPEETEDKFLIDSKGKKIEVKVTELHRLIARKIKTLRDSEGRNTGRITKPQDLFDLRRLVAVGGFDKSEAITRLSHIYQTEEGLDSEQATSKAIAELEKIFG
jgi:hypothetical protein